MGLEAPCTAHWKRRRSEGKALLEATDLVFRGEFRLRIPFREMKSVVANDGELRIASADGTARFELGPLAAKWADKIKNPKTVLEKLGVKPGMRVAVIGVDDPALARDLERRVDSVATSARPGTDLVFFGVTSTSGLSRLRTLRRAIHPAGAIWAVWHKGRPELKEDHIRTAAIGAGLTDVKVVAFSASHSALKLVIPVADR
ncbi:MAG TPA: DUF3052 domain-containing protein [Candidatus Limnocylindria bacterium]|nr:DUF3052 domain-containing protein [Candidatus Limnocylindria bacterium]